MPAQLKAYVDQVVWVGRTFLFDALNEKQPYRALLTGKRMLGVNRLFERSALRGSYPRQNGLALALREMGRIERTLLMLEWLQNPELRRCVNAGLNKSEAKNALARAVFFNRLGELRDRSFENQRYRASGPESRCRSHYHLEHCLSRACGGRSHRTENRASARITRPPLAARLRTYWSNGEYTCSFHRSYMPLPWRTDICSQHFTGFRPRFFFGVKL
jgi:Tn3 transposase DDE domain/Flavodoxin-like fold